MKVLLLSLFLIVLLHCYGGLSMIGGQPVNQEDRKYANLHWLVKKIRGHLLDTNMTQRGKQFAFVLLGTDTLLNSVGSFIPNPILISAGQTTDTNIYNNLLVAVPSDNRTIHSEATLLGELYPRLYNAYMEKYHHRPEFILLYSNLMLCGGCTTKLINFKNSHGTQMPGVKWFVGYHVGESKTVSYINEKTTKLNVDRLKKSGIRVFKVDFAKKPSLFSNIEQRKRGHM